MERRCFRLQYVVKKQEKFLFRRKVLFVTAVLKTEDSGGFPPAFPRLSG